LRKTYLKTASLIANGCRSVALLGDFPKELVELGTEYGKNLGYAYQVKLNYVEFL
jgi:geranylgeranyl pyrophosphate synthase